MVTRTSLTSNISATLPGIQYALTTSGSLAGVLNTVLGLLGVNLNQIVSIVNGVVNVNQPLLNQLLGNPLLATLGHVLPLNLTATLNGVTAGPIPIVVVP